jgi:hypothetical protein
MHSHLLKTLICSLAVLALLVRQASCFDTTVECLSNRIAATNNALSNQCVINPSFKSRRRPGDTGSRPGVVWQVKTWDKDCVYQDGQQVRNGDHLHSNIKLKDLYVVVDKLSHNFHTEADVDIRHIHFRFAYGASNWNTDDGTEDKHLWCDCQKVRDGSQLLSHRLDCTCPFDC